MNKIEEKLNRCLESIRRVTDFVPKVALILGSGLGDYATAESVKIITKIPYSDIEGFPVSTVPGHKGQFIFGTINDVPVVIMQGRVHYYEGYPMSDVVLPIRLMKKMGAEILFLTNAAGGCNPSFNPGCFMMITDQITTFIPSPLIGENIDSLGVRFPDMSEIYNNDLREIIRSSAKKLNINLNEGVYCQFTGPAYETPAEVRLASKLGADAVGMSTACEALAANHMGMKICGISCITNMAAGIQKTALNHKEVQEIADRVSSQFKALVTDVITEFNKL